MTLQQTPAQRAAAAAAGPVDTPLSPDVDGTLNSASDTTEPRAADRVTRNMRALALAGLLGLIVLCLGWELWWARTGNGTLALKVLPLLPCVLGLLRHRMYTFRWLSLLLWLYVLEGLVRATSEVGVGRVLALIEVALALLVFAASGWYIRHRLRNGKDLAGQTDSTTETTTTRTPA